MLIRPLFALLLIGAVSACAPETPKPFPHALMTPEPKAAPDVTLTGADGKPFTTADLKGKWTWVYFGFAHCPDVCPAAMSYMADEYKRLKHPEQVVPLFISVDPQRDDPATLKKYANFYHPAIRAATGTKSEIDTLAGALGASYVIDPPKVPGGKDYNVSHANMVFVLDPQGRQAAVYVPDAKLGKLAEDFDALSAK